LSITLFLTVVPKETGRN